MRIDLYKCDRTSSLEGAEHRDWNSVIAAKNDGQRACREDFADSKLGPAPMCRGIARVVGYVAAIDDPDRLSVEQGPTDIEIPAIKASQRPLAVAADVSRGICLVVADLIDGVGGAIRNAKDGDIGFEPVEVVNDRKVVETLKFPPGRRGERFIHLLHSPSWDS